MATSSAPAASSSAAGTGIIRDDRLYRETRWLALFIIPFLVVAFYILYLRTSETGELFAWKIDAPMTSMMLGSAYIGGAYFFLQAARARRWHWVGVGFLPVTTFASFMCVATLLHLDRFNQGHISFYAWAALYFTTPILVFVTWLRNRHTDPGTPDAVDFKFPRMVQYIVVGSGVFYVIVAILLMIQPAAMIDIWPWALTQLTARVVGGMLALLGVFGIVIGLDGRWSSSRVALQSLFVTMLIGLIAVFRTWDTFDQSKIFTWIYVGTIAAIVITVPIFYIYVENRLKKQPG